MKRQNRECLKHRNFPHISDQQEVKTIFQTLWTQLSFTVRDRKTHELLITQDVSMQCSCRVCTTKQLQTKKKESTHPVLPTIGRLFCFFFPLPALPREQRSALLAGAPVSVGGRSWMKRHPWRGRPDYRCPLSSQWPPESTVMLFDRLLSLMGGINKRQRLEWTEGTEGDGQGRKPGAGWTWAIY